MCIRDRLGSHRVDANHVDVSGFAGIPEYRPRRVATLRLAVSARSGSNDCERHCAHPECLHHCTMIRLTVPVFDSSNNGWSTPVSYTHLRAHETPEHLVCRLL